MSKTAVPAATSSRPATASHRRGRSWTAWRVAMGVSGTLLLGGLVAAGKGRRAPGQVADANPAASAAPRSAPSTSPASSAAPGVAAAGGAAGQSNAPTRDLHSAMAAKEDQTARGPVRRFFSELVATAKQAFSSWSDDYAPSMGAALSYYTLFSIGPLVLIVIAVAGLVFGEDVARNGIFDQLNGLMGEEGANAVAGLLKSFDKPASGALGTIIGIGVLLIGATTVFAELQDSLDRIWRAPARDKSGGLWRLLRARLLSFGMILTIGFLLIVSLVMSAAIAALGRLWGGWFGEWPVLSQILDLVISFGLTTVAFAMIYKIMPRVSIRWRDVWFGAAVTALLFAIGKLLIGLYIGRSGIVSGFGAASSMVLLLVWVYYSAQIFLLGAEFTWVVAHRYGSRRHVPVPLDPGAAVLDRSVESSSDPQAQADVRQRREAPDAEGLEPR